MHKYKTYFAFAAAFAYLAIFFASRSLRQDETDLQPGGRTLLQVKDDNETECTAEENRVGLPYNYFVECMIGNVAGAMVILVIWWLLMFIGLATCADEFFCPALVVISEALHLSPNVAGVTLLALGNGAPDFFAAFSALSGTGGSQLGIGAIFGAAIFVTTILIGVIAAIKPFKASERPFLRDIIFYMGAVYWGFFMLWRGKVYFYECVGYVILYVVYVVIVILSSSIYKRLRESKLAKNEAKLTKIRPLNKESFENKGYTDDTISGVNSAMSIELTGAPSLPPKIEIVPEKENYESLKGTGDNRIYTSLDSPEEVTNTDLRTLSQRLADDVRDDISQNLEDEEDLGNKDRSEAESDDGEESEPSSLMLFLYGICPVNIDQWPEMSIPLKIFVVFKSPMMLLLTLACPVVSYEDSENHNWNRPLQTFQLLVSPSLLAFLIGAAGIMIAGVFPVFGITLIIGAILAAINFFLTSNFPRPKYHNIFAIYGFVAALVLIYVLANEIVGFLQTFGRISGINETILGLTFLAWGNSMGDLMANVVMARQGFPKMSFAACFGASLFNLTLGFGFSMIIKMVTAGVQETELNFGSVELVLSAFLIFSLIVNLVGIALFQRFKITRLYGGILLFIYLVFLVVVLLTGTDVILKDVFPL